MSRRKTFKLRIQYWYEILTKGKKIDPLNPFDTYVVRYITHNYVLTNSEMDGNY